MFIFFIVYIIFNTHVSQKYVICIKTTTSPKPVFQNMHIYQICETRPDQILQPARRYLALQCIEVQCIPLQSLAILCITLLCITLLSLKPQCITLLSLQIPDKKDPNFFANVRTRLQTDFIDFSGLKSVFVFWLCLCFV